MFKILKLNFFKGPWILIPLTFFLWGGVNSLFEDRRRGSLSSGRLEVGFRLGPYSTYFIPFCSLIGRIVILFRFYYMKEEEINSFTFCLTSFILFMLLLTSSFNLTSMFLGWEGVGVISFLLIGWFSSRFWAREGSKKAVLFNRISDFFFLFLIILEIGRPLWVFSLDSSSPSMSFFPWLLLSLSFVIRTIGKSAQFLFHPWLTSAMEGPTPVSSLLHRRTIVVAGVYLFLFLQPFLSGGSWILALRLIGLSSSLTLFSSSVWALSQEDVKKVVALSTTRQLSLIILVIFLNLPELAFLHIVLHGFFKALIFIGRGVSIHSGRSSQDFRTTNISLGQKSLFRCFLLGNLGLIGFPFLGAFFRKHALILEIRNVSSSFFLMLIILTSFSMTIGYRLKLFFSIRFSQKLPLKKGGELGRTILPLFILSLLVLGRGLFEGLEKFHFSPKFIRLTYLGKWNFFLLITLGLIILFLSKHSSSLYNYSFSSTHSISFITFFKPLKFLGDVGGEKLFKLTGFKNAFRISTKMLLEFRRSNFFRSNFFSTTTILTLVRALLFTL